MNGNDYYYDMIEKDDLDDLIKKLEQLKENGLEPLDIPEAIYIIAVEISRLKRWLIRQ